MSFASRSEIDHRKDFALRLASRLDAVTLHTFLERSCYFSSTAAAIELRVRAVFGVESSAISLLFFLTFMISQAAGGWPLTVGRGGAQGICQRLADRLGPGTVMMGRRVTSVEDKDDKVIMTTLVILAKVLTPRTVSLSHLGHRDSSKRRTVCLPTRHMRSPRASE